MINIKLIYESLILENMSLEDIYEKYYKNEIKTFIIFELINSADPTATKDKKGKYLDWLIRKAYKNNPKTFAEDASTIKDNLILFDKYQKKIGKQITQVKDKQELMLLVKEFKDKKDNEFLDLNKYPNKNEIEVLYNDSNWTIVSPKTVEASVFLGKNTEWCTAKYAANDDRNAFNYYNKKGPLYILINKDKPKQKFQFHFQTEQYMDIDDVSIAYQGLNYFSDNILNKLVELANKNDRVYNFLNLLDAWRRKPYLIKYEKEYKKHNLTSRLLSIFSNTSCYIHDKYEEIKKLIKDGANIHENGDIILGTILSEISDGHKVLDMLLDNKFIDINGGGEFDETGAYQTYLESILYNLKEYSDEPINADYVNILKVLLKYNINIPNTEIGMEVSYQLLKNSQNDEFCKFVNNHRDKVILDDLLDMVINLSNTLSDEFCKNISDFLVKLGANA